MTDRTTEEVERVTPGAVDAPGAPDADDATGEDDARALRRRLMMRTGMAAALVLALLGGLAVFDHLNAPPQESGSSRNAATPAGPPALQAPVATKADDASAMLQVPPLGALEPAQESMGAIGEPGKPALQEEQASRDDAIATAVPEASAQPTLPGEAPLGLAMPGPVRPELRGLTRPASPRLALMKPSAASSIMRPAPTLQPAPAAELTERSSVAPASRPLTQAAMRNAYLLQLGVFSSTQHAEELRAKLELNGIPAQIETRVQVGPFASRAEAEEMREKLRKLGMEGGMLVAKKK